jgi:hypothetical protein
MSSLFVRTLAAVATTAACLPAPAHTQVFYTTFSGAAESPPNDSNGSGWGRITIDDHDFTMRVEASFEGLTGNVTAAHIHCCTANPGSGTAGVATRTPTFLDFPSGTTYGTYDKTFDMTLASSWNAAFISANGGSTGAAFSVLLTGIDEGKAYFNIHTSYKTGGEIRGFLAPVPEPGSHALLVAGLGLVGWAARRRA